MPASRPNIRSRSRSSPTAQMLAWVCPTAMIFVPGAGGISHNVREYTAPAQIEAGANVLLHLMLDLAG
ncbi:M20/M25/M40 family metallo-hydrolase [Rhodocyclaceae bacterium SMB388]